MRKPIEFLNGARQDFDESFDWYAERNAEAAVGFAAALDEVIARIRDDSSRFATVGAGYRYCALKQYPFRVVFREESERVVIVAVAHAKRHPGYWKSRKS